MIRKIVSGGQTGADRAALDVALEYNLEIGGWVPNCRLAEDGLIPARYGGLIETESSDPAVRTCLNVRDSDATVIFSHGPLDGGSLLTLNEARRLTRPVFHVDLMALTQTDAVEHLCEWLHHVNPRVLNIAGPRVSEDARIYDSVAELLQIVLQRRTTSTSLNLS